MQNDQTDSVRDEGQMSAKAPPTPGPRELGQELSTLWGPKTQSNADAIKSYVGSLPAAERDALRRDPRNLAYDAGFIQEVFGHASAPQPESQTIAGIEKFMKTNRRDYNRNEPLQARLRAFYDERLRAQGK